MTSLSLWWQIISIFCSLAVLPPHHCLELLGFQSWLWPGCHFDAQRGRCLVHTAESSQQSHPGPPAVWLKRTGSRWFHERTRDIICTSLFSGYSHSLLTMLSSTFWVWPDVGAETLFAVPPIGEKWPQHGEWENMAGGKYVMWYSSPGQLQILKSQRATHEIFRYHITTYYCSLGSL